MSDQTDIPYFLLDRLDIAINERGEIIVQKDNAVVRLSAQEAERLRNFMAKTAEK